MLWHLLQTQNLVPKNAFIQINYKGFPHTVPIPYIKRHKRYNCTWSAEIFRDSFTLVTTQMLSLSTRCHTSFINCFPSSLPAYSLQNLLIEWNLEDVGDITVIITDTNECATCRSARCGPQRQIHFYAKHSQKKYEFIYVFCWLSRCHSKV